MRAADTAVVVVQVWLQLLGCEEGGKVNSLLGGHTKRDVSPLSSSAYSTLVSSFIILIFNTSVSPHPRRLLVLFCYFENSDSGLHQLIDIM